MSEPPTAFRALAPEELTPQFDLERLGFTTTEELVAAPGQLGEDRAISALRLGIRLRTPGYNVFFTGLEGPGRETQIRDLIRAEAGGLPTPSDLLYVFNFDDPDRPVALRLPPGDGRRLRQEMDDLVATLQRQIPEALKKEGFEREKEQITNTYDKQLKELFHQFQETARQSGILVRTTGEGQMVFIPLKDDGEPVNSPEDFENLSAERKQDLEKNREEIQHHARDLLKQQQEVARKVREEVEETVKRFAGELVEPLVAAIAARHPQEGVRRYLDKVRENILANLDDFQEEEHAAPFPFALMRPAPREKFLPYQVNLLVDNAKNEGAPIVVEDSPSYQNLFGTIERIVDQTGKLITNFTRIKAGSLLKANGGFLVFNLDDALTEFAVWKPLKRVLKNGRIEIESYNPFSFLTVSGMNPEPIEIDTRLVVTGSRYAYAVLSAYDPDFREIFKVLADFVPDEARSGETELIYALRVAQTVRAEGLRHFTRDGLGEVLRFGVREAGDRDKLSSALHEVDDLVREASLVAAEQGTKLVDAAVVRETLARRVFRANWMEERGRELVGDGTLLLDVTGKQVGQVNGLAVILFGSYAFGRAARLTASVSMGSAGIINIEREAKLSGSTHDKGMLIIAGYLRNRFGQNKPLSFSASLCFEQTYSGIDGDSASSAELYALLSRLGNIPLRQDLAVTGSVNQRGEIQAIGGVNEKVEGFFRTCRRLGLTGTQGVVIPAANVRHLALHPEVIEGVRAGEFGIYAVRTVEEGMELLSGVPAGAPGEEGTVLGIVDKALLQMGKQLKEFGSEKGKKENGTPKEAEEKPAEEDRPAVSG